MTVPIIPSTTLRPPVDYEVIGDNKKLTVNWKNYYNQLWFFFNFSYVGNIPVMPTYTTTDRDAIDNPQDGMIIYNSTIPAFQGRQAGAWINL